MPTPSRHGISRAMLVFAALTLLPPALTAQKTRDSAGVRIIENARPAWTSRERLSLAPSPQLVFGDTTNAPLRFRQVRGVFRLSNGQIAVADGGSLQLRYFSADGRFLSASAGRGRDPGQVSSMNFARRLHGDTIAIGWQFASLSFYAGDGSFVRTTRLPEAPDDPLVGRMQVIELLNDGRRVAMAFVQPQSKPPGTHWVESLPVALLAPSGAVAHQLGALPVIELEQHGDQPSPPWLSAIAAFAGGDDRFYAGFGDRYSIRVYSGDGALRHIIRRAWTPVPITPADWERWVIDWSALWVKQQGAARDSAVDVVRRSPYAETLPAFSAFLIDRAERLWVRSAHWEDASAAGSLTDLPAVASQWSVFDTIGRWLGDVEMPANFQPYDIGTDYVLGKARRDGVNQIVMYVLRAGGTR